MRCRPLVLLAGLIVVAGPADAWDSTIHASIFEAARRLSPVVDARFDPTLKSEVLAGVTEADLMDKDCLSHRALGARAEAWVLAADLLEKLRNPKPLWTPRYRARLFGEYLHYVADCSVPPVVLRERVSTLLYDLALYRTKRPLSGPLADSLKGRALEAQNADPSLAALPGALRDVVNLTIDAALLLSERPGTAPVEDKGPVVMVPFFRVIERAPGSYEETPRMLYAGIHAIEWTTRKAGSATVVRALVQNNLDFCVRHVFFRTGDWVGGLTASLPPMALKVLEFQGPPSDADDVVTRFIPGGCADEPERPTIPLSWRFISFPQQDGSLQFAAGREYKPQDSPPKAVGEAFTVEYLKTDLEAIGGLEIPAFQARARDQKVEFDLTVRNRSERSPKPLYLELQVGSTVSAYSELTELKFDIAKLPVGAERQFKGTVAAKTHGDATAIRIFRIRRDELTARKSAREVKW